MPAINGLRRDELERQFADWGRPVVVRRVTQTGSAATGDIVETTNDLVMTAVVRDRSQTPTGRTASQHGTVECEFLFRVDELPSGMTWTTSRIVADGREYSSIGTNVSADGLVVVVHGQQV